MLVHRLQNAWYLHHCCVVVSQRCGGIVDWRQRSNDANSECLVYEKLKNGILVYIRLSDSFFIKIPHLFAETTWQTYRKMWCYTSLFVRYIFSIIGDFICYLLTAAVILTTKSLLLLIFINIIPIQMFLLIPLRLSLSAFGILIYPILINIPNSSLLHELLPACSVLISAK